MRSHSPAEWDRIVLKRASALVRIHLRGRKLPHSKRPLAEIEAERDRLHVAHDRAYTRLVDAIEGRDLEYKRADDRGAAAVDGKQLIHMTTNGLRFLRARKVKAISRMAGSLYPRILGADVAKIDAELAIRSKRKRKAAR